MEFVSAFIGLLLVYYLQRFLYRCFWDAGLKANIKFSKDRATEGESLLLEESIINRKILPLPMVSFKFKVSRYLEFTDRDQGEISDYYNRNELFSVLMFQKITRRLPFKCTKRGVYEIKTASLVGSGLLFGEEYLQEMEPDIRLVVYPKCVNMELFHNRFENLIGDVITQRFMNEDPFTFRGIREYSPQDPMKKVNWKASAKTLDWKVNIQEFTMEQDMEIYLNLQWETLSSQSTVLEESIRLAKTFCMEFHSKGMQTSLYTNGLHFETKEPVLVADSTNRKFVELMNEGLAKIKVREGGNAKLEYEFDAPSFCELYTERLLKSNQHCYRVFISNYQHMDFQELLVQLIKTGQSVFWIIPSADGKKPEYLLPELESKVLLWDMQWEEVQAL